MHTQRWRTCTFPVDTSRRNRTTLLFVKAPAAVLYRQGKDGGSEEEVVEERGRRDRGGSGRGKGEQGREDGLVEEREEGREEGVVEEKN